MSIKVFCFRITKCYFLLGLVTGMIAQERKIKEANKNFENFAYVQAIEDYQQIVKGRNANAEIFHKLADAYYLTSDLSNAATWYQKSFERYYIQGDSILNDSEIYFRAMQSYKSIGNYKAADSLMQYVLDKGSYDSRAYKTIQSPVYLEEIEKQSGRYTIEAFEHNSEFSDFAPSFKGNKMIFSSSRGKSKSKVIKNKWTAQSYLDLYEVRIKGQLYNDPKPLPQNICSRLHESTSVFTEDEKRIYFTRNNILKSKATEDSLGVIRLKIYTSVYDMEEGWSDPEVLPFCSDEYSVAHPSLNKEGTKLYFASDMPGGQGQSDIYVVDILEGNTFSEPENLGAFVNTEGRDTFPFIEESGTLYFVSDGHLGLGGLDIFATRLNDPLSGNKVYNVGKPINSPADDMTFIIKPDTQTGYFASNRKGQDDIYQFIEKKPLVMDCNGGLEIKVVDGSSGEVLAEAQVTIKDEDQEIIYSGMTDSNGMVQLDVDCNEREYLISVEKEAFEKREGTMKLKRQLPFGLRQFVLEKDAPDTGIDLAVLLDLEPIYFESNKALILGTTAEELDKVVWYLKEYPTVSIEIGSHTDSRGSDRYNLKLSDRRALATANYIISKGVDPSRVKGRGYGETVLKNRCGNGVRCSKEEHRQNRRSEFIVTEN